MVHISPGDFFFFFFFYDHYFFFPPLFSAARPGSTEAAAARGEDLSAGRGLAAPGPVWVSPAGREGAREATLGFPFPPFHLSQRLKSPAGLSPSFFPAAEDAGMPVKGIWGSGATPCRCQGAA